MTSSDVVRAAGGLWPPGQAEVKPPRGSADQQRMRGPRVPRESCELDVMALFHSAALAGFFGRQPRIPNAERLALSGAVSATRGKRRT